MNVSKMRKGFTLLELVIVIVVIGILAAIAIPSYGLVVERANMASAQTTATALVAEARVLNAFDNVNAAVPVTPAESLADAAEDLKDPTSAAINGSVVTVTVKGQSATATF